MVSQVIEHFLFSMPNTASAKKRLRQSIERRARNRSTKTSIRTLQRKIRESITAKDVAKSESGLCHAGEEVGPCCDQERNSRQRGGPDEVATLESDQVNQDEQVDQGLRLWSRSPRASLARVYSARFSIAAVSCRQPALQLSAVHRRLSSRAVRSRPAPPDTQRARSSRYWAAERWAASSECY